MGRHAKTVFHRLAGAAFAAALTALATGCTTVATMLPDPAHRRAMAGEARHQELLERHRVQRHAEARVEARAAAQAKKEAEENPEAVREQTVAQHLRDGDRHRSAGRISKAYLSYLRAHWADKGNPVVERRIAYLALRADPIRAEQVFTELIGEMPGEATLHTGLGMARLALGDFEGARDALLDAVALDPNAATSRSSLGIAYDRLFEHEMAQQQLRIAHDLRPEDVSILNNLGVSYLLSGDYARAAEALRGAIARGSSDPATHNNLGLALGFLGDDEGAFSAFRRAGTQGDAYNNLGYVHFVQGRYERASELFEKALLANDTDESRVVRNLTALQEARAQTLD